MGLRIYHLKNTQMFPLYDVANGFVVQANSEEEARKLCALEAGDETEETWLNPGLSVCTFIGITLLHENTPKTILRDYNAG